MISVVITAHDRKTFLLDAVNSVLNQTLNRGKYEIIVVKNFKEYDDYLESKGVKSIYTEEKPTGKKIAIGVEESKGNVICLLDDDDMFTREKLEIVYHEFKDPRLVFYNNSKIFINEHGDKIGEEKSERIELLNREKSLKFLRKLSLNISSTCVNKQIIDLKKLRNIGYVVDVLMYYFAVNYGGKLVKDSRKLTLYRLHGGNFFAHSSNISLNEFIAKRFQYYDFITKISKKISDEFKGSYAERLAMAGYLSSLFFYTVYKSTAFDNRIRSLLIALKYLRQDPSLTGILFLGSSILFLIYPQKLYSILYSRYLKKFPVSKR